MEQSLLSYVMRMTQGAHHQPLTHHLVGSAKGFQGFYAYVELGFDYGE